ncbi:MAG: DUF4080 domain-containing protein [Thermoanaerobacteraceae bacterium]|nr:DUF4080 domain-containing protein [Thermoanaerobacteraceae bacterium]
MKLLLVALNSQYIHTNLAVRYLKAAVGGLAETEILELTVNDHLGYILKNIYEKHPDVIGFSCYIWNIELVRDIIRNVKKILPQVKLILGGPEVSFDPAGYIHEGADFVVSGEGEYALKELIYALENDMPLFSLPAVSFEYSGKVITNPPGNYLEPSLIPFPYDDEDIAANRGRIIYYETSRGCPFNCVYCLSSLDRRTRFWDIDRVDREILWLYERGVRFIKLVDRTFNCNKKRAVELFKLLSKYSGMRFHMEMVSAQIDESIVRVLRGLDPDMFQFEIGVQSLNENTLKTVRRNEDFEHLTWVMNSLNEVGIKTHLDLIAGLPNEGYESIVDGFNRVYNLEPSEIQLGFLKLLKGTSIREETGRYGIKFLDKPPYEILCSDFIDYEHLSFLKNIAFLIDKYYNSHCFDFSLKYLLNIFKEPYEMYFILCKYLKDTGFFNSQHSRDDLYCIFLRFIHDVLPEVYEPFAEILRFDFLLNNGKRTLECFGKGNNFIYIKGNKDTFGSSFSIDVPAMNEGQTTYIFYKVGEKRYFKKAKEGEENG